MQDSSTATNTHLQLLNCEVCPFSERVRFALFCKKIPFEANTFDDSILLSDNKPQALISRNPNGSVPVLDHNGFSVYDSTLICHYLEEAFPNFGIDLWPKELSKKYEAELLLMYLNNTFVPHFMSYLLNSEQGKEEELQRQFEESVMYLEYQFEKLSDGRNFFLGESISIVDIFLAPFVERMVVVIPEMKNRKEEDVLAPFRKLRVWYKEIQNMEHFIKAQPDPKKIVDFYKKKANKKKQSKA